MPSRWSIPTIRMTVGRPDLQRPITPVGPISGVYGVGVPFQASATRAGLFCNLRGVGVPVIDFEVGTDVVLFDRIETIRPDQALALSRNEPVGDGKRLWVKYPVVGGFVPLGARRAAGGPHPYAGTGFGLSVAIAFPADHSVYHPSGTPGVASRLELQQHRFDGRRFEGVETQALTHENLLPGWRVSHHGLTMALPDGDDLLLGLVCYRPQAGDQPMPPEALAAAARGYRSCCGVSRWRFSAGGWRPCSFQPVPGTEGMFEPSLIRCPDGSLAMSARGTGDAEQDLVLWHCPAGTREWRKTVHVKQRRSATPVSLNRTADGVAYLAFNPWREPLRLPDGRPLPSGEMRQSLTLLPLDPATGTLGHAVNVLDGESLFGPPPGGSLWRVDHPIGAVVRLADGRWHSLLAMRVCEKDEVDWDFPPTPQTGCWVEEVTPVPAGPDCPAWSF